jgi:hypothetical protein
MNVFGFFRRARRDAVPEWAEFFTPSEFEGFMAGVRKFWADRGLTPHIEDGMVRVTGNSDWPGQMGLTNVAQKCHMAPRQAWSEMIQGHFDSLLQSQREQRELDSKMGSFEGVRELLAVRIGSHDLDRSMLVAREDLPGTVSYLCLDLPSSVVSVSASTAAKWGVPLDELFAVGLENVRRTCVPELTREALEPDVPYLALTGSSFFVATHALMLRRWQGFEGTHGSLVTIPHRHALICHPINDLQSVKAVHMLGIMAHNLEKQGPGSITPNLYWYRDGQYILLPYEIRGGKFNFKPPDEFVQMLNELAKE